jgi:microcystin-dependent protein
MSAIYPPGIVLPYAGPVNTANPLPSGWLLCDGSSISRSSPYDELFKVIGTTYGSVDSATFKLPDLRGRVVAGLNTMSNTAPNNVGTSSGFLTGATAEGVNGSTLGATGGEESHLLISTESGIASHSHITYAATNNNTTTGGGGTRVTALITPGGAAIGSTSSIESNASAAHNNVQPTLVLNYMIKI